MPADYVPGSRVYGKDQDVEFIGVFRGDERLAHRSAAGIGGEIVFKRAAVDGDLAAAGRETDAGDGGLATAGAVVPVSDHRGVS